jgi:succinate-semialdehyde dehydrogenase/glutarate-semialdehyde dehydrogenase
MSTGNNNSTTINPATEEKIKDYAFDSGASVDKAVNRAHRAFADWRLVELSSRLSCVETFAEALRAARLSLAEMMTAEMGKTLRESLAEIDKCVAGCKTLIEKFPQWKAAQEYDLPEGYAVRHRPLGVLLGIMPWNYPLWQVFRFAVPALLCGNTILLKHAPNTWGTAEFIADIFARSFPEGVYNNLKIEVSVVEKIIADSRVRGVSLTGSRRAGISVGELAGRHLKKCVLELGGSDAYVILDDADIEAAAGVCAQSRLLNAGQSCISAKRFIVTAKNTKPFTEALIAAMAKIAQ